MPTKKPRINVVLDGDLYVALGNLANKKHISVSLLARDFIAEAFELYEDRYWESVAAAREQSFSEKDALSHDEIWEKK